MKKIAIQIEIKIQKPTATFLESPVTATCMGYFKPISVEAGLVVEELGVGTIKPILTMHTAHAFSKHEQHVQVDGETFTLTTNTIVECEKEFLLTEDGLSVFCNSYERPIPVNLQIGYYTFDSIYEVCFLENTFSYEVNEGDCVLNAAFKKATEEGLEMLLSGEEAKLSVKITEMK